MVPEKGLVPSKSISLEIPHWGSVADIFCWYHILYCNRRLQVVLKTYENTLGLIHTERQHQCCDVASNNTLMGCNPNWSDITQTLTLALYNQSLMLNVSVWTGLKTFNIYHMIVNEMVVNRIYSIVLFFCSFIFLIRKSQSSLGLQPNIFEHYI